MTTGTQLKLAGIEKAASHYEADLRRAQNIAEVIATGGRIVTADDVREVFQEGYGRPLEIENALGNYSLLKRSGSALAEFAPKGRVVMRDTSPSGACAKPTNLSRNLSR